MKLIVITGPSGSGKTILSNKLSRLLNDTLVVRTDSYYRDDNITKLSSKFLYDIYDRLISIKRKELLLTLKSIFNKEESITFTDYDFKSKLSTQSLKFMQYNKFIILEGIFAHRLNINYKDTINILCTENKEICYQRRLDRDQLERGRDKKEIRKRFNKSWHLYFKHIDTYKNNNNVILLNPSDSKSYEKLISRFSKKSNNIKNQ